MNSDEEMKTYNLPRDGVGDKKARAYEVQVKFLYKSHPIVYSMISRIFFSFLLALLNRDRKTLAIFRVPSKVDSPTGTQDFVKDP